MNGYHEDILEALRNAASTHRSSGNTPSGSISEEILRKTLQECTANNMGVELKRSSSKNSSKENICDTNPVHIPSESNQGTLMHHHRSQQQLHQQSLQQVRNSPSDSQDPNEIESFFQCQEQQLQQLQQQQLQQQIPPQQLGAGVVPQYAEDDDLPSVGPLRIRNLEDLIRQLEQHSSRHMSPSGSEDIRMSETEAERHYRLESSAACSESSHG